MSAVPSPRRGSFWETWRLFSTGGGRVWVLTLGMLVGLVIPLMFIGRVHPKTINLIAFSLPIVFCLAWTTWHLEGEMGERLAFLSIVPQPVDTRRLLLVPMCTLGLALAIVFTVMGRLPVSAALALLGVAWWTVAGTRWLWKVRFWPLFVLPVLAAAPLAAHAAYRVAGLGAAAAVSLALGIGALAFQPRPYMGEPLMRRLEGGRTEARVPPRATFSGAISAHTGDRRWLASTTRFMEFTTGWILLSLMGALNISLGLLFPISGHRLEVLLWPALLPAMALAEVYSGDMHEFLRPRPVTPGQRFVGGALPSLLIALILPATAACFMNLDWINHGGLLGLFKKHAPSSADVSYLRDVLGATFLPEKWPEGGLPPHLWARLRPFLYLDALRAVLLIAAVLFAIPVRKAGEPPGRRRLHKTSVVILLAAFVVMFPIDLSPAWRRVPLQQLWFIALLACVSIAHWVWQARAVSASAQRERERP